MRADPPIIVDGHEDIAYNTVGYGRAFTQSVYEKRRREAGTDIPRQTGTATTGLPEALLGRVGIIFGTLFTEPTWAQAISGIQSPFTYDTPAQAYKQAVAQIDVYQRLADEHDRIRLIRTQSELESVLATWGEGSDITTHTIGIVLLMEGGDPIPEPKAFEEWYERGVRIVGPAWSETRYSGGTRRPGPLTDLGRGLLEVMASFNAILDLSHMAEESYLEAVDRYEGHIIASHSNPRRFCNTDRHLSDDMIRRLAERDGVMGVVPYNLFLRNDWKRGDPKGRVTLNTVIGAIDHVCQITGSARHVGIGSDFDGGFGVEHIPAELDTVSDLRLIGPQLTVRGYTPEDVQAILGGNFLRVLRAALPR
ncbi:MAG: membrane dipeptidase [Anaerolineae bacterium]|nr:membrane dipeptidase [Anaerolineae bacterium]